MSRFFVPKEAVKANEILIEGEEAHHILDVMRLKELDKVVAFDGTGKEYIGFIKKTARNSLVLEVVETRIVSAHKKSLKVTLIQAIPKKDKMSYIVEKATELGVNFIIPVVTKRTIPDWDEAKRKANIQRWRKIAKEASKQCGRTDLPDISEIKSFSDLIKNSDRYGLGLLAALSEDAVKLKAALAGFSTGSIAIAIGPEGDFTADEIERAKASGFRVVNLGERVLKSDTAGLAALSMINYEFSN